MSWDAAVTTLEAIMTAAGTATGKEFTIQGGEPSTPPKRTIAWWYEGLGDNPLIPETLTDSPFGDLITVRAYWPVSTRSGTPARALEMEVRDLANELYTRLEGDRTLGGNVEALTIPDFTAGWLSIDGQWFRTLSCPLTLSFTDEVTISR